MGDFPHQLTDDERRRGAETTNAARRAKRDEAEQLAIERLADKLETAALRYIEALDAEDHPTKIKAADRVFDRVLGRPAQGVAITGQDGGPVQIEHRGVSLDDILRVARGTGLEPRDRDD